MDEGYQGTITANSDFNPGAAAKRFYKSMKGMGTDERVIIDLLVSHDSLQREEIKQNYKSAYGRDLISDLKEELGGHFEDSVVAMLISPYDLLVTALHDAFKGAGADENILTEILCCRTADEIESLHTWYKRRFNEDLDEALESDLSGDFQYLMRGLVAAGREEDETRDSARARKDAQDLYDAGVGMNAGNDESEFIRILNNRSYPQLQETMEAYEHIAQEPIEKSIKNEFSGDLLRGLLAIVQRVKDPLGFYAERLHKSLAGAGTDDRTLIRILVSRSQVDLADIRQRYKEMYNSELSEDIKQDTSGDYRKLLLAVVGK